MPTQNRLILDIATLRTDTLVPATSRTEYLLRLWRLSEIIGRVLAFDPVPGRLARATLSCLNGMTPVPGDINANPDAWTIVANGHGAKQLHLADEADPGQ